MLFSRSAFAESRVKKLHSNKHQNALLHQALYNHTLSVVKETQLPYFVIDETQQYGTGFGEKFCNAIEYCFGKGFTNIITVGSDCATLTASEILAAQHQLQCNTNTIGKDIHGGFYLLSLQRNFYRRNLFLQLGWGSNHLTADLCKYFTDTNANEPVITGYKTDLNNSKDLSVIIARKHKTSFICLLCSLCSQLTSDNNLTHLLHSSQYSLSFSLRGPPSVVLQ